MNFLRDLHVLVLGLGESGLAMARWCVRHGATVRVWDSRDNPPHAQTLRRELPGVEMFGGELPATLPEGVRLLLKSPGLAPHDARVAPLLQATRAAGIAVMAELDLFTRALADLKVDMGYSPKVLAITGTNGKTTTTAMTGQLVARTGQRVAVAGNIMPTMLDRLGEALDEGGGERPQALPQVWVLELSSFQLQDAGAFEPDAAALLNITQDHLDWHGGMDAYVAAKARVFGSRGTLVINRDDPLVAALAPVPAEARASRGKPAAAPRPVLRFGVTAPTRPGDFGLVVENGMAWLVRAMPVDETFSSGKRGGHGKRGGDNEAEVEVLHLQHLMPADALRIRGRHNAANALAALALATAIGCPLAPMLHGLRDYAGEPHRVQSIGTVGGVEAIDDTKGTNVGATVAALEGLGADRAPARIVVILGGDGKGQDFTPLAAPVKRFARAVALIGRDAPAIEAVLSPALTDSDVTLLRHATLPAAVAWCFAQAHQGDAVLLSPACASLDMFRNYVHRGEVFVEAVRELAAERGEPIA